MCMLPVSYSLWNGTPTGARYVLDARDAAFRGEGFEESGSTHLALGLGCYRAFNGVLARRTLGVGGAGIGFGAAGRWLRFKESGRTRLALVGRCRRLPVFPARTPNLLDGGAGVGLGAAGRRGGFEESGRTRLALVHLSG